MSFWSPVNADVVVMFKDYANNIRNIHLVDPQHRRGLRGVGHSGPAFEGCDPARKWNCSADLYSVLLAKLQGRLTGDLFLTDLSHRYFYEIGYYQRRDDGYFLLVN